MIHYPRSTVEILFEDSFFLNEIKNHVDSESREMVVSQVWYTSTQDSKAYEGSGTTELPGLKLLNPIIMENAWIKEIEIV